MPAYRNEENNGKDIDDINIKFNNDIFKAKYSPGFNTWY